MIPKQNDSYSFNVLIKLSIITLLLSSPSANKAAGALEITHKNNVAELGIGTVKNNQSDYLKLYAHSQIVNDSQYQCFYKLITKESNWRVDAKNGSHYGIGQMRNIKYKNLDGFTQVDWSKRYIKGRYGSMCNAWRFYLEKGWH